MARTHAAAAMTAAENDDAHGLLTQAMGVRRTNHAA
jgi:hypothetical protein